MMKKIFLNFIMDKFIYIIGFFASTALVLLYCFLTAGVEDLIYPVSLSLFIFLITLSFDFARYYKFNTNIQKEISRSYYDLQPVTREQREISDAFQRLHEAYAKEISSINMDKVNQQHFLSLWIHNMKTPVSVIALIVQKIKMEMLFDENLVKDIEEENNKLLSGLEQILNIMRVDEFFRDYEPEVVDLVQQLKEVINNKKSQFIYNNVYPKLEVHKETVRVITDSKWNKFMLDQIVSNSIKYSQSQDTKKNVTFRIRKRGESTFLEIVDEGVGIPSYDLKRVFEPFFTGENGRKFKNSTGIGLYISTMIADKLGHSIKIQSEVDKGTQVTISYITKV